ncbi:MAG: hypothetical protein QOJ99_1226 [Bryobacterales bacterium]|jgi:outer membrane protein assembly factor BamB|nr:hypothetical protein [Bryobacterales bacterium]
MSLCARDTAAQNTAVQSNDTLLTISGDGWLVSLEPQTGAITQYHVQLPLGHMRTVAYDPLRMIVYSTADSPANPSALYAIDPQTGKLSQHQLTSKPPA